MLQIECDHRLSSCELLDNYLFTINPKAYAFVRWRPGCNELREGAFVKTRYYLKCIGLALGVLGLAACQQAQHSFETDSSVEAASTTPDVVDVPPSAPGPAREEALPDTRIACGAYMNIAPKIDLSATQDRVIQGDASALVVDEPLRTVSVTSAGGPIDIRSAITAYLISGSGQIRMNAQEIPSAKVGSGNLCIRANHIGSVDASQASGPQVIIAYNVDSIALGNAAVHIYNATVEHLAGTSGSSIGSYHQICLHNGAVIKDYGSYSPSVANTNCGSGNPFF